VLFSYSKDGLSRGHHLAHQNLLPAASQVSGGLLGLLAGRNQRRSAAGGQYDPHFGQKSTQSYQKGKTIMQVDQQANQATKRTGCYVPEVAGPHEEGPPRFRRDLVARHVQELLHEIDEKADP
jgi:hypothetical protein